MLLQTLQGQLSSVQDSLSGLPDLSALAGEFAPAVTAFAALAPTTFSDLQTQLASLESTISQARHPAPPTCATPCRFEGTETPGPGSALLCHPRQKHPAIPLSQGVHTAENAGIKGAYGAAQFHPHTQPRDDGARSVGNSLTSHCRRRLTAQTRQ